ncbi:MAG: DUF3089 domain-containing protein [Ruminococcaceae bacterium]|nr:DUF3089 domain-containing protein [Oscillospiraceae bacterium]
MRKLAGNKTLIYALRLTALVAAVCLFITSCSGKSAVEAKHKSNTDYSKPSTWACFNDDGGNPKEADCFLICPTVYVSMGKSKNMTVSDPTVRPSFTNAINDQKKLYSDTCAVYAPFYGQAAIEVYDMSESEAESFFETAYADIENAFVYFLKNTDGKRPFVLAGFSQGADMCIRLLKDHGNDPEVVKRLVACYAIGWRVTEEDLAKYPHLKTAQGETDTGVIIAYDCEAEDVKSSLVVPEGKKTRSINPLNWKTDQTPADKSLNKGSLMNDGSEKANMTGCYIDPVRGTLKVTDVTKDDYPPGPSCFSEGEYHVYDYKFFFRNLQDNVKTRLNAFKGK